MLSWSFLWRSFFTAVKHPWDLTSLPFSDGYGARVYDRRKREWNKVKDSFADIPRTTIGSKIYLNPSDLSPVSVSIGTTGWFNLALTSLVLNLTKRGMRIIDVGANIGYFTLLFASLVGPSGAVISYEPEPMNCSYLRRSVALNKYANVVINEAALSENDGETKLHLSPPTRPQEHSTYFERQGPSISVRCTSLNSVFTSLGHARIDILKVRVSGAEGLVLKGGLSMIEKSRPVIITVYSRTAWTESRDLLDRLFELYDFYEVIPRPWLLRRVSKFELGSQEWVELCLRPKASGSRRD